MQFLDKTATEQLKALRARKVSAVDLLDATICAEDTARSKPDPDAYLKAAARLGVSPTHCLVFEDSIVGIQSAKAAGMQVVAITHRCNDVELAAELADHAVTDYRELAADFFAAVSKNR